MHCKNCGAYFVRFPCTNCGEMEPELEIEESEEEQLSLLIQEESLQKPSKLKGGSAAKPIEELPEDPSLLKPSELNPDILIDPTDPFDEKDQSESLVKPSEITGRTTNKVKITSANLNLQPIKETINGISEPSKPVAQPQRLEGETDEEYKNRVRDTLLEVMSLLEKLIE